MALTVEAAAMAGVPLAGTNWIPGKNGFLERQRHATGTIHMKRGTTMGNDLAAFAKKNGVKYFMISFTDLFGGQRAKLVPAQAIATCRRTARALPASPPGST